MTSVLAMLAVVVVATGDEAAASLDRQQFTPDQWPYLYYISTAAADSDEARQSQDIALRLILPSLSRQPILERCLPTKVSETMYRIDLREMQWNVYDWQKIVGYGRYPYNAVPLPLVLRADWLLVELTDEQEADAYYNLIFGARPKTRDEALKTLGVDGNASLRFGLIEGESGVAKQGTRWIENRPISRGYAWGTFDVLSIDAQRDPLEAPQAVGRHDGEEWIIGVPKIHLASGTRGALQVYFLANGQGAVVERAPVDLVEDRTEFRGYREIRTAGSCINCHVRGLNLPTRNELRETLASGVELAARFKERERIEAFHLSDVAKELRRNNEDFGAIVQCACGCSSVAAAARYQLAVTRYDEPVTLERAACELYIESDELRLAIAWANQNGIDLGPRFPSLAHGRTMPRDAFKERFLAVKAVVDQWRILK
jgi:hypothetical protein